MAGVLTAEDWQNEYSLYDNIFEPYVEDICEVIDIRTEEPIADHADGIAHAPSAINPGRSQVADVNNNEDQISTTDYASSQPDLLYNGINPALANGPVSSSMEDIIDTFLTTCEVKRSLPRAQTVLLSQGRHPNVARSEIENSDVKIKDFFNSQCFACIPCTEKVRKQHVGLMENIIRSLIPLPP
ncbi:uncharacterized protein TRIADDRAFT_57602 [Trichoplax adhaerens]|uniref:Uncharacterized protein n=1 Tax=Trichoplax adhaerens TaxID=10228 RepID=B3RZW8_TRIAD|nr:predicted protein [Trichoplax adhaerens]EDV24284.1 predicted protein [Trichoplax adhaerens]|eukprot:XP_002113810.1 predicted protein [Trichoplax adhaerens]